MKVTDMALLRYRKFKRTWGMYYAFDTVTGNSTSLNTRVKAEADQKIHAMNETERVSAVSLGLAKVYLNAADPKLATRTWQEVMERIVTKKKDETRRRWETAIMLQNLDEVLSFRPFGPEDADLKLFELITSAIRERRGLQFDYRKPGAKTAERRRVHPYHLMQFNNRWYLLAHDSRAKDIRKFVLGRMRDAQMTAEKFTVPKNFDAKKFFDRSLGVMTGQGDYEVVIEMDAWLTDILRGRKWHPSQVWTEVPGGGSQLRMRLSCLEEMEQWVLSWGNHATVIAPTELREQILNTLEFMLPRYGGAMILHE